MNFNTYPNPWDLRYFQEIARTQNLSRAAERLGVGQPALSLALKRLEEGLQAPLFQRRSRGLILTAAGQRLLKETNVLLANWEALVAETKKSTTELVGRFSLGCHPSVGLYALKNIFRQLYSEFPGIEIQLVHGLSRIMSEGVISGQIDFAIVVNPLPHPDLVIHRLATDRVCFWHNSKSLADVLIYNPELRQSQDMLSKLKKKNLFRRTISSESLEVIATLANSGAGIAILPARVAEVLGSELKKVPDYPTFSDEIAFVYRVDLPKTAAAKCIIDTLKNLAI